MFQNIVIGIIVVIAIVLVIRHFKKGQCDCCGEKSKCGKRNKTFFKRDSIISRQNKKQIKMFYTAGKRAQ
jgi:hypothetical protein